MIICQLRAPQQAGSSFTAPVCIAQRGPQLHCERRWPLSRVQSDLKSSCACPPPPTHPGTCHVAAREDAAFARRLHAWNLKKGKTDDGHTWWQYYYEPTFSCPFEERIGAVGEGGKWICDPYKLRSGGPTAGDGNGPAPCLVYSVGSHGVPPTHARTGSAGLRVLCWAPVRRACVRVPPSCELRDVPASDDGVCPAPAAASAGQSDFEQAVHDDISADCEIHTFDILPWETYTDSMHVDPAMPEFMTYHTGAIGATGSPYPRFDPHYAHGGQVGQWMAMHHLGWLAGVKRLPDGHAKSIPDVVAELGHAGPTRATRAMRRVARRGPPPPASWRV